MITDYKSGKEVNNGTKSNQLSFDEKLMNEGHKVCDVIRFPYTVTILSLRPSDRPFYRKFVY